MNVLEMPVERLAGLEFDCVCGKRHKVEVNEIRIGRGVLEEITEVLSPYDGSKALLVSDVNTYKVAGEKIEGLLKDKFILRKLTYSDEILVPDEKAVGRLVMEIEDSALVVAAGSGALNDITRFACARMGIPFVIAGTAPSMDGYTSTTSALIMDGVKKSFKGVYPAAIIADLDIMANAPMHLIHAGLGDILGKYTALCDWELARVLDGEFYCPTAASMIKNALERCVKAAPLLPMRDIEAVREITEALLLSGITIGMVGCSRPVSGEEHQFSHCWEMVSIAQGKKTHWRHGNEVGVGTGVVLEAYRFLLGQDVRKLYSDRRYMDFTREKWIANVREVYGSSLADKVIGDKMDKLSFDEESRERKARKIVEKWEIMKNGVLGILPDPDRIRSMMQSVGAVYHPAELGVGRELFKKSVMVAKDIRNRFSVMQLLEDMGVLEEFSEVVTRMYYK